MCGKLCLNCNEWGSCFHDNYKMYDVMNAKAISVVKWSRKVSEPLTSV